MLQHIKILSHDRGEIEKITRLIDEVITEYKMELTIEKIENNDEINSYCIKRRPGVLLNSILVHDGNIPTKKQIAEWFVVHPVL
jgi:hypothetical protein